MFNTGWCQTETKRTTEYLFWSSWASALVDPPNVDGWQRPKLSVWDGPRGATILLSGLRVVPVMTPLVMLICPSVC